MHQKVLLPAGWPRPSGYSNGIAAQGRQVFISGQIGWDSQQRVTSPHLTGQVEQALKNIVAILAEAGGRPEHIVRLTWYLTSREEYVAELRSIGEVYRTVIGRHFPAMTAVQVAALIEREAKVEIEATAVIPEGS